jgi:hypothetical protein
MGAFLALTRGVGAGQARVADERAPFNPLVQGSTPWRPTCGYGYPDRYAGCWRPAGTDRRGARRNVFSVIEIDPTAHELAAGSLVVGCRGVRVLEGWLTGCGLLARRFFFRL